jgi:hypothetical protein
MLPRGPCHVCDDSQGGESALFVVKSDLSSANKKTVMLIGLMRLHTENGEFSLTVIWITRQ